MSPLIPTSRAKSKPSSLNDFSLCSQLPHYIQATTTSTQWLQQSFQLASHFHLPIHSTHNSSTASKALLYASCLLLPTSCLPILISVPPTSLKSSTYSNSFWHQGLFTFHLLFHFSGLLFLNVWILPNFQSQIPPSYIIPDTLATAGPTPHHHSP